MQRPTLQGVRIRSTRDALQVFNGVATNRLPLITRRLDAEERRSIVPGNVYVWCVSLMLAFSIVDAEGRIIQGGARCEYRAYRLRNGEVVSAVGWLSPSRRDLADSLTVP